MLSLKSYLVTAVIDWATDQGTTPYLLVDAQQDNVHVPEAHVQNGQIVLNVHPRAIENYEFNDEIVSFMARFGSVSHQIYIPVAAIQAVYAKENGEGLSFINAPSDDPPDPDLPKKPATSRPQLKVVK